MKKTIFTILLFLFAVAGQAQIHYRLEGNIGHPEFTGTMYVVDILKVQHTDTIEVVNGIITPKEGELPEMALCNLKDTTIALKDTVFLIGNILPERGTHIQKYFWKDPNNNIFKEFQIKFKPTKPGNFVYHFTIVDFHGDSLSDSVQINVSTPPVLDSIHWLPENNSSRLSPDSVFFSWNASDKDNDNLFYIFEIFENNKKIIDTL